MTRTGDLEPAAASSPEGGNRMKLSAEKASITIDDQNRRQQISA